MFTTYELLVLLHLIGLSLGVGGATVKIVLLIRANTNIGFMPVYIKVTKPITRLIVLGTMLLILTGIIWLIQGYSFIPLLTAKVVLVGIMLMLGPVIDNAVEPKLLKLAPEPGATASPEFLRIKKQHLVLEVIATVLMYSITVLGVML